jgi:hypothetical protein
MDETAEERFKRKKREASARWLLRNPNYQREKQERWKQKDPLRYLLSAAKSRAKKKGLVFDLSSEDLHPLPTHCPVFGIELVYGAKHAAGIDARGGLPNSASLDRKDPGVGYVKGNVRVMSWRANSLLKDATLDELEQLVAFARKESF